MSTKRVISTLLLILFISTAAIFGGGSKESDYQSELSQTFSRVSEQVSSGEISVQAAQSALDELRKEYKVPFTDKDGILSLLLYRLGEGEISVSEARTFFSDMTDSKEDSPSSISSQSTGGDSPSTQNTSSDPPSAPSQTTTTDSPPPASPPASNTSHTGSPEPMHSESHDTSPTSDSSHTSSPQPSTGGTKPSGGAPGGGTAPR